jgi:hypothetical protein
VKLVKKYLDTLQDGVPRVQIFDAELTSEAIASVRAAHSTVHNEAAQLAEAGVTATHGSVSEPCNHLQKFPQPQWLLGHYLQGSTAIEAYWKSVLWPQQSLFVGEPLAAPFARIDRS